MRLKNVSCLATWTPPLHTHTHTHTYIHTLSRSHALPQCWILALAVLYARWLAESCGLTSRLAATYRTLGCLKCSPRAQAWGLARDGEPIKQGREGEAKRPPPCGRGGATTGSLCQGPLKVCIFKFFSSLVLSAALQMWSVPYMLLHSLAVFHLVISRHLRKQQRFLFFFPNTFSMSNSLPTKTKKCNHRALRKTHPPAISIISPLAGRCICMWMHNITHYAECTGVLVFKCNIFFFGVPDSRCLPRDRHINQTYDLFFFTRLISGRWTQMALLERACRTRKGREGQALISFGSWTRPPATRDWYCLCARALAFYETLAAGCYYLKPLPPSPSPPSLSGGVVQHSLSLRCLPPSLNSSHFLSPVYTSVTVIDRCSLLVNEHFPPLINCCFMWLD